MPVCLKLGCGCNLVQLQETDTTIGLQLCAVFFRIIFSGHMCVSFQIWMDSCPLLLTYFFPREGRLELTSCEKKQTNLRQSENSPVVSNPNCSENLGKGQKHVYTQIGLCNVFCLGDGDTFCAHGSALTVQA